MLVHLIIKLSTVKTNIKLTRTDIKNILVKTKIKLLLIRFQKFYLI